MDCRCDVRFRLINAVYGVLILIPFDKDVKEQVERGLLSAG